MNVAVLIEGRNFYAGCKRWAREDNVDFLKLRNLIKELTNGTITTLTYYMGVDHSGHLTVESNNRISDAIQQLQSAGYAVRTFPLRVRSVRCRECDDVTDEIVEKQVDSAIAVDAMNIVHAGKTDLFVLVTSDTDQLPLAQAIRAAGKKVWLMAWQANAVSNVMIDNVDKVLELEQYRQKILAPRTTEPSSKSSTADLVAELTLAEQQFQHGYVGLHYFLTHWKSQKLPRTTAERSSLLNELFASGAAIQYTAPDGNAAVRLTRT